MSSSSNLKPLLLHGHSTGPNPMKIAIALEALGVPYTIKLWELGDNPTNGVKGTAFAPLSENGRVPVLEDPNTQVKSWESGACMNYVRRVYDPTNKIGPRVSGEQGIVDFEKWEYFLLTTLGPMMGQVNWFRHYHDKKNEDALERYVAQAERCLGVLEGQLEKTDGKSVLVGGVSAVDYHFEPWVRQYKYAGLDIEKYPYLKKWIGEIQARDEVKRANEATKAGVHA